MKKVLAYTLVVIDMQVGFAASRHRGLRGNIKIELHKALKNNCDIVFVTYGKSPVISSLFEIAIKNPSKFHLVNKEKISAAGDVLDLVLMKGLTYPLKICGIQTDCCVLATVRELSNKSVAPGWGESLPNIFSNLPIEVLEKCCASYVSPLNHRVTDTATQLHDKSIKQMSEMPNVKII